VLWDGLVYPYGQDGGGDQRYLIEVGKDEVGEFVKHLKRHKLRSKVVIRDVGEEWRVWSAWRGWGEDDFSAIGATAGESLLTTPDPRMHGLGDRVLLRASTDSPNTLRPYETLSEASLAQYTVRRYLHGVAEGQHEILREASLPMESNMDYLNGIDFRKGCYIGQELTIRTQHTGVIRKRIVPVQLYGTASPAPSELSYSPDQSYSINTGTDIKAEGGRRPAGKFLASVGNIGLALCRLENMTDLRVSAEGGTYKEGVEFTVASAGEGEEKVKIKAFVPEWMRVREQEKMERRARREDPAVE
jgi:folate-binding protein YgfZ